MSYNLTLYCGCLVYVACDPHTQVAHARILEQRGPSCRVRRHEVGLHLNLWDLLPDPPERPLAVLVPIDRRRSIA